MTQSMAMKPKTIAQDDVGRLFARPWRFVTGARDLAQLPPPDGLEVAFAGRSNVGKSSLINALTGQKTLARTSNTPGRTREINFFASDAPLVIVDLPGYGYAAAPKAAVKAWTRLIHDYLRGRPNLARVYLLIDARHGIKDSDGAVLETLDQAAVSYQAVLTKVDKLSSGAVAKVSDAVSADLAKRAAAHPEVIVTSATAGHGIDTLRVAIAEVLATRSSSAR
jgi:GTP-binding protein